MWGWKPAKPEEDYFPVCCLLPKKETGVISFLTKNPKYDGTGVAIAIFDTGVDPGAPGLQVTSSGTTKVIERFDCSGCGDVDTSTIVEAHQGCITGLSGRVLKIPANWKNPSQKYRIGLKCAFDMYPDELIERISKEYKEEKWNVGFSAALADVTRKLKAFENVHLPRKTLKELEKLAKEDLQTLVEVLNVANEDFQDNGPCYDCVLFNDGSKWIACVDTTENGELEKCQCLSEYSLNHEFTSLTESDQLNYSINVHDNGNVLELVGLCGSHGTHVASIAAAYFPEEEQKNGMAPGAQIVSLTIGDGRLGGIETGTAVVRACIKVIELQKTTPIKVVNMSYGEFSHWSNSGRVMEIIFSLINTYGIVFVTAAGNDGPALSTISAPPDGSQDTIIGVGAYVSPEMMVAEYSMRKKLPGTSYTWSSRGPTLDGGFGVTICTPGSAITSVPNCYLTNSNLKNGTSMASPNAAGTIALIISGLDQNHVPYSPYSIKRALENKAQFIDGIDVFAQGCGLLQVEPAFNHLMKFRNQVETNVRFHITCGSGNKGIYFRSLPKFNTYEYVVFVEPFFIDSAHTGSSRKINFNIKLSMSCPETYVKCPSLLDLSHGPRTFAVTLTLTHLAPGVYTTSVSAHDTANKAKGPIFRVPITIIIPLEVVEPNFLQRYNKVPFKSSGMKRNFFVVPQFATWATVKVRSYEKEASGNFFVHCMQLLPKRNCKALESKEYINIIPNTEFVHGFAVNAGSILEVVLAKYWASEKDICADYSVEFHGIKPNHDFLTINSCDGIFAFEVTTLLGEEIEPRCFLDTSVQILPPVESKLSPLSSRDVVPPGRQIYELILTYRFILGRNSTIIPNNPLLSEVLYESEFESQLWMIFDCNKQYMGSGDAYPERHDIDLPRGWYVLRQHIRHENIEYLNKLLGAPILLDVKLKSPIPVDILSSFTNAIIGGPIVSIAQSLSSSTVKLYVTPPSIKDFSCLQGHVDYLTGYITFSKDPVGKRVDLVGVKCFPYVHEINQIPTTSKTKTKLDEFFEEKRDFTIAWMGLLDVPSAIERLYEELKIDYPEHLLIHTAYMDSINTMDYDHQKPLLKPDEIKGQDIEIYRQILIICNQVIVKINQQDLLAQSAVKFDARSGASGYKQESEMEKTVLIDCLCRKGIYLCRLYQLLDLEEHSDAEKAKETINLLWVELLKFVDPSDATPDELNVIFFTIWHATINKHYGRVIKFLGKLKTSREVDEKLMEIYEILGWQFFVDYLERSMPSRYPPEYRPF